LIIGLTKNIEKIQPKIDPSKQHITTPLNTPQICFFKYCLVEFSKNDVCLDFTLTKIQKIMGA
jgi:hypothetical protein